MKIYTKNGDSGQTQLLSGEKVYKSDERLQSYGECDTLNCHIGHLICYAKDYPLLSRIQHKLFDFGALLACTPEDWEKFKLLNCIKEQHIIDLEIAIDAMESELTPLKNFILPGGSISASLAHICRTSTRKVERNLVFSFGTELRNNSTYSFIVKYFNRLSDYFFVLARYLNFKEKQTEIIYKKE